MPRLIKDFVAGRKKQLEAAWHIAALPDTLRLYAKIVERDLLWFTTFTRKNKTFRQQRPEMTRIFVDHVKLMTGKDRIDSVVLLFNLTSRHLGLNESFEKKALGQQLRRLREKYSRKD